MLRDRRRLLVFTVLGLAAFLLLGGCARLNNLAEWLSTRSLSQAERLMQEGDRLFENGQVSQALLAYRHALKMDSHLPSVMQKFAALSAAQGQVRTARYWYGEALKLEPEENVLQLALLELPAPQAPPAPWKQSWSVFLGADMPAGSDANSTLAVTALDDGRIFAIDLYTGSILWSVQVEGTPSSRPALAGKIVLLGMQDGNILALDSQTGAILWNRPTGGSILGQPAVMGETVFIGSTDNHLYCLNISNGALLWAKAVEGEIRSHPLVSPEAVYVGTSLGRVNALRPSDGALLWPQPVNAGASIDNSPALVEDRILVGTASGIVLALDAADGRILWQHETVEGVFAPILTGAGGLYTASAGGVLSSLNPLSGEIRWEKAYDGAILVPVLQVDDSLWFALANQPHLYSVNALTGEPRWQWDSGDWIAGLTLTPGGVLVTGKDGTLLHLSK